MAVIREVLVPDMGDFDDVEVIEVLVQPGDTVKPEDPLITIESDKATMDVPSPEAGTVQDVKVKVGDTVNEGTLLLLLESSAAAPAGAAAPMPRIHPPPEATTAPTGLAEVYVPDIGDYKDVPVIEVLVQPGDTVKPEDPLITIESDKAIMDVPAPLGGVVQAVKVQPGDKVSEGMVILTLATDVATAPASPAPSPPPAATAPP